MRLIDADALIKEVNENKELFEKERVYLEGLLLNATTVDFCKDCEDKRQAQYIRSQSSWYELQALRKFKEKHERPQGEWIYGEDDCGQDGWFCSECDFFVPWYYQYYEKDIDFIRDYKVCPHCKAEMITYTGKDRDVKGETE